jgi:hypothetical protein
MTMNICSRSPFVCAKTVTSPMWARMAAKKPKMHCKVEIALSILKQMNGRANEMR